MLVDATLLRHHGQKRAHEEVQVDQPTRGDLTIETRWSMRNNERESLSIARLLDSGGTPLLEELIYAQVTRLQADSFVVIGLEVTSPYGVGGSSMSYRQAWGCRLVR